MTLEHYMTFDLSPKSDFAAELASSCDQEAAFVTRDGIRLSSAADVDAPGPNLTPSMRQIIAARVAAMRQLAWCDVADKARTIRIAGIDGVVLEVEEDRIERTRQQTIAAAVGRFLERNTGLINTVSQLQRQLDEIRLSEGGRAVKLPSPWLEYGLLLPLILVPESLLNYESFRQVPLMKSPFMALAGTLLVGFALAYAAQRLGLFAVRRHYYMHPGKPARRKRGFALLKQGTSLLTLGMSMVGVARYYYTLDLLRRAVMDGTSLPSVPVAIGSLLFGNLLAVSLGVAVTFSLHDANEDYRDIKVELLKRGSELEELRAALRTEIAQADENARRELEQVRNRDNQMSAASGYVEFRRAVERLKARDTELLGHLDRYRGLLASAIRSHAPHFEFQQVMPSADRSELTRHVPLSEFLNLDLRLWRLT